MLKNLLFRWHSDRQVPTIDWSRRFPVSCRMETGLRKINSGLTRIESDATRIAGGLAGIGSELARIGSGLPGSGS